jgi:uncharacterized protein YegP (UPF0339 family)
MIHIHRSKNKQLYFTITAKNGRVLVTSETYKQKRSIRSAITAIRKVFKPFTEAKIIEQIIDHTIKPHIITGPMILPPRTKTKKNKK